MSGIEVAAAVFTIIQVLGLAGKAVNSLIQRRKEKKLAVQSNMSAAESQLVTTLQRSPPRIQNDYDNKLARIGPVFGRGDGNI